ncbi:MAG: DUF4476 domain-containing protein [Lentimicrobiaceae bacterium]|nr:DUF4476 domain-containing protein [Lentimicrobiaceae bacterium]MCO5264292.1 DUF4476 domain-containing protein [Lentimicrobium sp.]
MKTSLITLLIVFSAFFTNAQRPHHCDVPIADHIFRQKYKSISMQPTEERKLQVAKAIAVNNCLSVEQVKSMASLFIDDFNRLELAKTAWLSVVDKENFYFVYDEFAYFSTVFMLHDYVKSMEEHPHDYIPPYEPPVSMNFPAFDYPGYEGYHGPSNCNYPIREDEFIRLAMQVKANNSEGSRMLLLTQITGNNCLSVSQAMKFASLLVSEANRLEFFKAAIYSIFDLNNLPYGTQLFVYSAHKAAYNNLISNPMPAPGPENPPCIVHPDEFGQIKESISKESFNTTRLTLAKQIIRSKKCFSVFQVTEMVKLISFEDTRLELAKFAYDFTTDRENYYKVADAFSFSRTKEELMKFLESKR